MIVFKNGTIVSSSGCMQADLAVDGEQIVAVGQNLTGDTSVDVTGKLLLPGCIDGHTHFDLDVCNTTTADDFASGTQSAILGGTTCVVDFATPNKGETLAYGLDLWHKKADGKAACDYGFHMTIDDWNEEIAAELPQMVEAGITSFKMYMTYPAMMIGDSPMFCALQALKKLGCIAGTHCENNGVIDALISQAKAAGKTAPMTHPETRPNETEAEAVSRYLRMAQLVDTPVVIVHLSTKEALEEVEIARKRGQKVFVETCPHYLLLNQFQYDQDYEKAARYICAPPLRKQADQNALLRGLQTGQVDTIATDHCSFTDTQKLAGQDSFTAIPGGMPGVETRLPMIYSELVATGKLSLEQMVSLLAENPAKLYGLHHKKGALHPGKDADIVVFDPKAKSVAKTVHSKANYHPYEGWDVTGQVDAVYLRGHLVAQNGKLVDTTQGAYQHRELPLFT